MTGHKKKYMSRVVLLCLLLAAGAASFAQKECVTTTYHEDLLQKEPSLRHNITAANNFLNGQRGEVYLSGPGGAPEGSNLPVITIPVVVHILYKEERQNITDEQVHSQLEILNKAFQLQHADTNKIPAHFRALAANCRITFCLAKVDPKGMATNGIVRKSTWVTMYGLDDRIKYSDKGGSDAWNTEKYLNIWVGNLAGGMVGYSSPVGGPADRDGIAVRPDAFGTRGITAPPYHMGKTVVHEVGHWLGLRHIWGDAMCGDDLVDDTPQQRSSNRGCPSGIRQSCGTPYGDMYMNYMDLTSDDCMLMFTTGQMNRMRSLFAPGGPRHGMLTSQGCTGTPLPAPIEVPAAPEPVADLINLYPNPTQRHVVIDLKEQTALIGQEIRIVNHLGQPVRTMRISQAKTTIDLGGLTPGVYVLLMDGVKMRRKFVKL
jgi:hypothetical protein